MIRIFRIALLVSVTVFILANSAFAQYATKKVMKKKQAYTDSIKQVQYDYIFPILSQKVYKAGFDIPYPIGLMDNYIWLDQEVVIENMQLGLKTDNQDIPLTSIDEFIGWGENTNTSYSVNFRPDIWVFPFLNVYGIFGYGSSTTLIELVEPIPINSTIEQSISTSGFGFMGAFGIGPV